MAGPDSIETLYDAHAGALFAYALNLTRSEADARDLLQDQFHRLARQPMPETVRDARGWLLRSTIEGARAARGLAGGRGPPEATRRTVDLRGPVGPQSAR